MLVESMLATARKRLTTLTERPVGCLSDGRDLALDQGRGLADHAKATEGARLRDGRGRFRTRDAAHGGLNDGVAAGEKAADRRVERALADAPALSGSRLCRWAQREPSRRTTLPAPVTITSIGMSCGCG